LRPSAVTLSADTVTGMKWTRRTVILVAAVAATFVIGGVFAATAHTAKPPKAVSYSEARQLIDSKKVRLAELDDYNRTVRLHLTDGRTVQTSYPLQAGGEISNKLTDQKATVKVADLPSEPNVFVRLLTSLLPLLLIGGFAWYLIRGKPAFSALSKDRKTATKIPAVQFSDVAGVDEAVGQLSEIVDYVQDPEPFIAAGAKVPHGVLLVGPPGTGKTLLARAVAGQARKPFYALAGSDFVEVFVGVGAARVREIFNKARKTGGIIFIDEVDALAKARTNGPSNGATDEREHALNALLVEMDGFSQRDGVIVLAATNRPDVLDPAMLRPGRFTRTVTVDKPDRGGREQLFRLYIGGRNFDETLDWAGYARRTPGMTGADIEQVMDEAVLSAKRGGRPVVGPADMENALATVALGPERRTSVITERDRLITAWHEAGHTLCAWLHPDGDNPAVVSIVPRGRAEGVTHLSGNDHKFQTRRQAVAQLVMAMGGRAAEEMHLAGDFTSGAASDLKVATDLATAMVAQYGMGARNGLVSLSAERLTAGSAIDMVNDEVREMLTTALTDARTMLTEHLPLLTAVVEELLEHETLTFAELETIRAQVAASQVAASQVAGSVTPVA
jgi:cell division protease FtsH